MKLRSYSLAAVAVAFVANVAFADVTPAKAPATATAAVESKMEVKKQEATTTAQKTATDVKPTANLEKTAAHKHADGAMKQANVEHKTKTSQAMKDATITKTKPADVKTGEGPKVDTSAQTGNKTGK